MLTHGVATHRRATIGIAAYVPAIRASRPTTPPAARQPSYSPAVKGSLTFSGANQDEKAYALVPMVAEFLRKSRPEVVKDIGDRLEKRAYAFIVEIGNDNHARLLELEAAWPAIAPALTLFLADDNARLQAVCDALQFFLNFTGRWDEWLALCERAETQAVAAADHIKAGWRAKTTGYIHGLRGQADAVITCADRAVAHWHNAPAGARERASAIRLRGFGHQLKEDYQAAVTAYREALELDRSVAAESVDVSTSLNALAGAERRSGDLDAAEGHYREALRIAQAGDDAEGIAICTGGLAEMALARGEDWPAAETVAREALLLSETVHRQELIAVNNRRLAQALVRQGKAAMRQSDGLCASDYARRAVEIYTRLASPDLAWAQATLAECEKALAGK